MKALISLLIAISLSGCTSLLNTYSGERSTGSIIKPGERLILRSNGQLGSNKICAEPPPDVASSLFSSINASLQGNIQEQAQGRAALTTVSNSEIVKLFERSQGIQGLRDGMYRTCEAYINGGIDPITYGQQMTYMTATLNFLVTVELCGKILDTQQLSIVESSGSDNRMKDLRPELYEGCLSKAKEFADIILKANQTSGINQSITTLK